MDFKEKSQTILDFIGGRDNIETMSHCATRLRFKIKDQTLVNENELNNMEEVLSIEHLDKFQLVVGIGAEKYYKNLVELGVSCEQKVDEVVYNTSPLWRLILFLCNNAATNMYNFGMLYISYYASGVAGLLVAVIGITLTAMRIFDGFTDPIIGYLIDKTNSKFGRYRPYMVVGNIILAITCLLLYNTVHLVPDNFRFIYFVFLYAIHILGYTCQTAVTKAGQACMTNSPKQRPLLGILDIIFTSTFMTLLSTYVSLYLTVKYEGFNNKNLFVEFSLFIVVVSVILTILAIIGIWEKDRPEFYGIGNTSKKVSMRDFWPIIKGNKALRMLVLSAGTTKLSLLIGGNATVNVMLFGIVMGDYKLSGTISIIAVPISIILLFISIKPSQKIGQKQATILYSIMSIILYACLLMLLFFGNPALIRLNNFGFMTIAFLVLYILSRTCSALASAFAIPMIADCADYEVSLSGKYIPGMMGTLFSFVDKLISSFQTTIVALMVSFIGFKDRLPDITDKLTPELFNATMIMFGVVPIIGWIISIIAMNFYPLDNKKMKEVQAQIQKMKQEQINS